MRSLFIVIGLLFVAGSASAAMGSARAIAGSLTGAVPEVAASESSLPPVSTSVGAIERTVEGRGESDTANTGRRGPRECPTRKLKGRYNRCR